MQNPNPFGRPFDRLTDNTAQTTEIDSLYESESIPDFFTYSTTQTPQSTLSMTPQQENILLARQKISNYIEALRKNARKQLKQADELEEQLEQLFNQQTPINPMPRRVNRNRIHRSHPYNEHSLASLTIQPVAPTDRHNETDTLTNSFYAQNANVLAATPDFPDNN